MAASMLRSWRVTSMLLNHSVQTNHLQTYGLADRITQTPAQNVLHTASISTTKQGEKSAKPAAKRKAFKNVVIGSKITEHDLDIKVKKIGDWLDKEHDVNMVIKNLEPSNPKALSAVFQSVTEALGEKVTVNQAKNTRTELQFLLKVKHDGESGETNRPLKPFTLTELKDQRKS